MSGPPSAVIGATRIWWCGGAVVVERAGGAVLLDAPPGAAAGLRDHLAKVRGLVLTGGRIQSVGGIVPLLVALTPHRLSGIPLPVWVPLGEERGAMLAEAWVRGWDDGFPLTLDAVATGSSWEEGDFRMTLHPVRTGEPRWREGIVVPVLGAAVRVETDDASVVWVPGAAPTTAVTRACAGVDLAIVEVGVSRWPRTEEPWRMSVADALRLADGAPSVWPVRDDGAFGPPDVH